MQRLRTGQSNGDTEDEVDGNGEAVGRHVNPVPSADVETDEQRVRRAATRTVRGEASAEDMLAAAIERGRAAWEWFANAEGGLVSAEELTSSRESADRLNLDTLIKFEQGGETRYPAWQVHEGRVLPGLSDVLEVLEGYSPKELVAFMVGGDSWLGGESPLEALRRGDEAAAVWAAEMKRDS